MSAQQITIDMDDLRSLVQEVVRDTLEEWIDAGDPDDQLVFKPDVAAYLQSFLTERPSGSPLD